MLPALLVAHAWLLALASAVPSEPWRGNAREQPETARRGLEEQYVIRVLRPGMEGAGCLLNETEELPRWGASWRGSHRRSGVVRNNLFCCRSGKLGRCRCRSILRHSASGLYKHRRWRGGGRSRGRGDGCGDGRRSGCSSRRSGLGLDGPRSRCRMGRGMSARPQSLLGFVAGARTT